MTCPVPYKPTNAEWRGIYDMLCGYCADQHRCDLVDGMIEMKDGADWPAGGWVYDLGAGVSCLSYQPKGGAKLSRHEIRQLRRTPEKSLPPVCGGCAARKGSEASMAHHTQKDFKAAVKNRTRFDCHETGGQCGGWCRAILRGAK